MDGMMTLHIGIAPASYVKKRMIEIARGGKPRPNEPRVWVSSLDSLARVLTEKNMLLLEMIRIRSHSPLVSWHVCPIENFRTYLALFIRWNGSASLSFTRSQTEERSRPFFAPRCRWSLVSAIQNRRRLSNGAIISWLADVRA